MKAVGQWPPSQNSSSSAFSVVHLVYPSYSAHSSSTSSTSYLHHRQTSPFQHLAIASMLSLSYEKWSV